jgi:hypothetical protein
MEGNLKRELTKFGLLVAGFLAFYFLPFSEKYVQEAIISGFTMLGSYAREHVLFCLVPAFFIAGTITVFIRKDAILKLLGPGARKIISYPVAAVSGGISPSVPARYCRSSAGYTSAEPASVRPSPSSSAARPSTWRPYFSPATR